MNIAEHPIGLDRVSGGGDTVFDMPGSKTPVPDHDSDERSMPVGDLQASRSSVLAIASSGMSGSTLLCRILGEVPGFVAIGEIGRIWDKGLGEDVECSCGEAFSRCPFWAAVGEKAFGGWDRLDPIECKRLAATVSLGRSRLPHPFALPLILMPGSIPRFRRDLRAYVALLDRLSTASRARPSAVSR